MRISDISEQAVTRKQRMGMMAAICMGAFISHFTAGIVNVSLPQFVTYFQADLGLVLWITTGYLLVITALLPVMGKLGDRYGFQLIHNLGYVVFTVGSILVAFAPNLPALLLLRVLQAIGAAMFQATNIALITVHLPKEKRGQALGIVSTAVALGGMSGPIAGGLIAEWLNWRWLFLIHVPVAIAATLMAYRYIPVRNLISKSKKLDTVGAVLFAGWISLVIIEITNGSKWGWLSAQSLTILSGVAIVAVLLFFWERRQLVPFLPLNVLRVPAIASGLLISCASFMLANTILVIIPFYLSEMGPAFTPSITGYAMTAYPIALAFMGPLAGQLSDRYGSRRLMQLGLSSMGIGFIVLVLFLEQLQMGGIVAVLAMIGMGMGLVASPNNSFIMRHTPAEHVGSIGGMIALTRNAGMVFGSALGLGVMNGTVTGDGELVAFKTAFQINLFICFSAMALLAVLSRRGDSVTQFP
ncbi:MFS transporter [Paenibacillaceae bacterium]|nr:MFS transporter [Paenibacillaceae bacterium]